MMRKIPPFVWRENAGRSSRSAVTLVRLPRDMTSAKAARLQILSRRLGRVYGPRVLAAGLGAGQADRGGHADPGEQDEGDDQPRPVAAPARRVGWLDHRVGGDRLRITHRR